MWWPCQVKIQLKAVYKADPMLLVYGIIHNYPLVLQDIDVASYTNCWITFLLVLFTQRRIPAYLTHFCVHSFLCVLIYTLFFKYARVFTHIGMLSRMVVSICYWNCMSHLLSFLVTKNQYWFSCCMRETNIERHTHIQWYTQAYKRTHTHTNSPPPTRTYTHPHIQHPTSTLTYTHIQVILPPRSRGCSLRTNVKVIFLSPEEISLHIIYRRQDG